MLEEFPDCKMNAPGEVSDHFRAGDEAMMPHTRLTKSENNSPGAELTHQDTTIRVLML
jgi:hypothetical protein